MSLVSSPVTIGIYPSALSSVGFEQSLVYVSVAESHATLTIELAVFEIATQSKTVHLTVGANARRDSFTKLPLKVVPISKLHPPAISKFCALEHSFVYFAGAFHESA